MTGRRLGITAGLALGAGLFLFPPAGLRPEAARCLAVLGLVVPLWVTEAIPLAVTALIGPALCVFLGVAAPQSAFAGFADPVVFLLLGGFLLAEAMQAHGLHEKAAAWLLSRPLFRASGAGRLAGMGLLAALVSMWISNSATTAMLYPVGLGLARGAGAAEQAGLMLMIAYAASVGGLGTPVGTPTNLVGMGMLDRLAGVKIPFFTWVTLALPMAAVMMGALWALLARGAGAAAAGVSARPRDLGLAPDFLPSESWSEVKVTRDPPPRRLPLSLAQKGTVAAFLVAVVLWVVPGVAAVAMGAEAPATRWLAARLPEGVVALLAAALLFVLPRGDGRAVLTWEEAARIDWGTILLFGGGLALGRVMFDSGLAEAAGRWLVSLTGAASLWAITAAATAISIAVSELTSNTASASMVVPVMIALSKAAGVSPVPPALGATMGASFGFMLPISTPPNAIVYGSGYVPLRAMIRTGVAFDLIGFVLITGGLRLLCPLLGLV